MEIKTLTKQELNAISAYLIHDKRDKSVTFNHKQMADLGLKLFNEVNNVRWDEPKNEPQALNLLAVSNSLPHPVHFGRWLLKHAETKFDKDGFLTWQYGKDEKDTKELYDEFLKDECGNDC